MLKTTITFLALSMVLSTGVALAQESVDVTAELELDEIVTAQDLGIEEPTFLPDSPIYFLKNWGRGIQSFFTFDSVKKAELRLRFANEKLIEVKKLAEKGDGANIIEKGLRNYNVEIGKIKAAADKVKENATDNENVGKFLDKFTKQQILHQRVLDKLETQVPEQALERIREARENHIEKFGEVMVRLETKERIEERLEKNLQDIEGSTFKEFKNLEVLKRLEEGIPEEAKEAIQRVQANSLIRLKATLEAMPAQTQNKFQVYVEEVSGVKEKQLEIIDSLKEELKAVPLMKESLIQTRERIVEQVREKVQVGNCPQIGQPKPGFCEEGRIVTQKSDDGCIIGLKCVVPAEVQIQVKPAPTEERACVALWDPVCGEDGKTYSNTCYARLAGVDIEYKGKCGETECKTGADCPQPKCGPANTISAKCVGVRAECEDGKCQNK